MKEYKCFLTGSRVYGTPKEDSDLDMVILIEEEEERDYILALKDNPNAKMTMFGNINLIVVKSEDEYYAWKSATELLESKKPVTKKKAKETIKNNLETFGCWGSVAEYEEEEKPEGFLKKAVDLMQTIWMKKVNDEAWDSLKDAYKLDNNTNQVTSQNTAGPFMISKRPILYNVEGDDSDLKDAIKLASASLRNKNATDKAEEKEQNEN